MAKVGVYRDSLTPKVADLLGTNEKCEVCNNSRFGLERFSFSTWIVRPTFVSGDFMRQALLFFFSQTFFFLFCFLLYSCLFFERKGCDVHS